MPFWGVNGQPHLSCDALLVSNPAPSPEMKRIQVSVEVTQGHPRTGWHHAGQIKVGAGLAPIVAGVLRPNCKPKEKGRQEAARIGALPRVLRLGNDGFELCTRRHICASELCALRRGGPASGLTPTHFLFILYQYEQS